MPTNCVTTAPAYSALLQRAPAAIAAGDVKNQTLRLRSLSGMSAKLLDITLACALITLPMVTFALVLLYLVFHYQMNQTASPLENLHLDLGRTSSSWYYIDFPATRLVFIASWSSSVSLTLASSAMLLISYPVAGVFVAQSSSRSVRNLPTPYQLSLLIDLLRADAMSLWRGLKYTFTWKDRQSDLAPSIVWSSVALCSIVLLRYVTMHPLWRREVDHLQLTHHRGRHASPCNDGIRAILSTDYSAKAEFSGWSRAGSLVLEQPQ